MLPANLDEMNEADLREEFIAPLIRDLGYRTGTHHNVIREIHLRYPSTSLGRKKESDPLLRGRADYICEAERRVRWIIEAKPPSSDISIDDIEQAYSYANHPEIRAVYFCVTNGHEFRIYQTNNGPASDPVERVTHAQLLNSIDVLIRRLKPDHVVADWPLVHIPDQLSLAPGLRSLARILGGRFDYTTTPPEAALLGELSFTISTGFIQRNEQGRLIAEVKIPSPLKATADFLSTSGLEWQVFTSSDAHISCDISNPTKFVSERSFVMPRGLELPLDGGQLSQDIHVINNNVATGHLNADRVFIGTFTQRSEIQSLGFRQEGAGTFSLILG